jgi:hypothetical protein
VLDDRAGFRRVVPVGRQEDEADRIAAGVGQREAGPVRRGDEESATMPTPQASCSYAGS